MNIFKGLKINLTLISERKLTESDYEGAVAELELGVLRYLEAFGEIPRPSPNVGDEQKKLCRNFRPCDAFVTFDDGDDSWYIDEVRISRDQLQIFMYEIL